MLLICEKCWKWGQPNFLVGQPIFTVGCPLGNWKFRVIPWSKNPPVIIPLSSRYHNEILPPKRGDNGMITWDLWPNPPVITPLSPRCHPDMSKVSSGRKKKVFQENFFFWSELSVGIPWSYRDDNGSIPWVGQGIIKVSPRYLQGMVPSWSRYVQGTFKVRSRYVQGIIPVSYLERTVGIPWPYRERKKVVSSRYGQGMVKVWWRDDNGMITGRPFLFFDQGIKTPP